MPAWAALVNAALVASATGLPIIVLAAGVEDMRAVGASGGSGLFAELVFAPVMGIFFSFIGALLFLGIAFRLVRSEQRRAYAIAGMDAGVAHAALGVVLAMIASYADPEGGLASAATFLRELCGLQYSQSPRILTVVMTFPAAAAAGALGGWVYAWLKGVPPRNI